MSKHTPGPWSKPHGTLIEDAEERSIALVNSQRPDGEANALLIKESPMLLKAAQELLGLRSMGPLGLNSPEVEAAVEKLQEAITRAEEK